MPILTSATAFFTLLSLINAKCYDPSPAFPVPHWSNGPNAFQPAFDGLEKKLAKLVEDGKYNTSSFSIEVTSDAATLWSHYHSAREHNATRPGAAHVDGDSIYRIASITKTFTVLSILQQHAAGNLSLDDPVSLYIPELSGPDSGEIPWKDITLRILASQLSGIPRETEQSDLINGDENPLKLGLPPASRKGLPDCYEYGASRSCNRTDLLEGLRRKSPVFAPNQKSTYSNAAFELLGLVIENVTGVNYSEYVQQAIFDPIGMTSSSLAKPSDHHAVLPLGPNFWDWDEGVHSPTGGIYSSSSDMDKYVRYVLTHYNAIATGVNWLMPASWATGLNSFYGMPFEIYRQAVLNDTKRPVTFVTKGGAVPGYFSDIVLMPDYGLGLTILTAGDSSLVHKIQEMVTVDIVQAAEDLIWKEIGEAYTGSYVATNASLNSSIELVSSSSKGLYLQSFISNGTDVWEALAAFFGPYGGAGLDEPWRAQIIPTLLYKDEEAQQGEIWRVVVAPERQEEMSPWDEFCNTDVDGLMYAGLPLNEVVFWHEEGVVELPAWRVTMKRKESDGTAQRLVLQTMRDWAGGSFLS